MKADADYLFEASWEVCNKVGGIYTVVKSKAFLMKENYKNYFLIGPYIKHKAAVSLTEKNPPDFLKESFDELEKQGIKCYYGAWDVEGSPNTILVDFEGIIHRKDSIKTSLWNNYGVDSLFSAWDFEEPMLWAWAVGMLLQNIEKKLPDKKILGHFHEWLAGFSVLYLKKIDSRIGTVFTTHATMLGRTIAGSGEPLYSQLDDMDFKKEAYEHKVQDKYLTEKASAANADIFTTVSEITAFEAEKILGRSPEVILNNGLTMRNFPTIEETSVKHLTTREKIREFLTFHFYPYYNLDLEHNLIYFIVGRYEYENKGIDVLVKALGKLNERLKQEKTDRTISCFFWIPQETHGVKIDVLENKNYYRHIRNYVEWNSKTILRKIVMDIIRAKSLTVKSIFTDKFLKDLEKDMIQFKRTGNPPVCTHNLPNEKDDSILKSFKEEGLDNHEDDPVKVILYPVYLDGNDSLINLPYYDAIAGSHFGLFPSYYEPWGYTPLETAAMGVASLTTDLAGFGRFIQSVDDSKDKLKGIYVLERYEKPREQVIEDLYQEMYKFSKLSHEERVKNKLAAKSLANEADWKKFVQNYVKAHNMALEK